MVKFINKVTKLALKGAAVCTGVAAGAAVLHKYVKIQSNCSGCGSKEINFDENLYDAPPEEDEDINTASTADTNETEEESDAISSDEATDSSSRRYINIHVAGKNSNVDINIDKEHLLDDAAKLVSEAAHLTKSLRPGSHSAEETKNADEESKKTQSESDEDSHFSFKDMDANNDIANLDIEDLGVDIDEDLSEGVSDLYAMDGVEEGAEVTADTEDTEDTEKHAEVTKDIAKEAAKPKAEEWKNEAPVNSSIHL